MAEKEWIEIGPVIGDTGPKGDVGDMGPRGFRGEKGDLYIKFDIQFPEYIDPVKKEEIIRLLS